jgi:fatty aldehyde decarbonylase
MNCAYRDAYSRINALVIVGEGLADSHFRLLAGLLPEDRDDLMRLAAMEGRHARDFAGCGKELGIRPDLPLAQRLFAPLHRLFREAVRTGDRVSALVIQCLIVESFAVAAYRCYQPLADAFAAPIIQSVLTDEAEQLEYGDRGGRLRAAPGPGAGGATGDQAGGGLGQNPASSSIPRSTSALFSSCAISRSVRAICTRAAAPLSLTIVGRLRQTSGRP